MHPEYETIAGSSYIPQWRCELSDFHEMANNLKMKESRSLHMANPAYMIDRGGRRLGIERREFDYSHYFPERRVSIDRRVLPERRVDTCQAPPRRNCRFNG